MEAGPVGAGRRPGAALHALPRLIAEHRTPGAAFGARHKDAVPRIVGAFSFRADARPHQDLAIDARRRRWLGGRSRHRRRGTGRRGDGCRGGRSRRGDGGRRDGRNRRRRRGARRLFADPRRGDDGRGSAGQGESGPGDGEKGPPEEVRQGVVRALLGFHWAASLTPGSISGNFSRVRLVSPGGGCMVASA
jgi:hypothetical protein